MARVRSYSARYPTEPPFYSVYSKGDMSGTVF